MADIEINVDSIISRLLEGIYYESNKLQWQYHNVLCIDHCAVRGSRPGKSVQMTESEVRGLCLKSREIFLQQPILLELEAPLKICGKFVVK